MQQGSDMLSFSLKNYISHISIGCLNFLWTTNGVPLRIVCLLQECALLPPCVQFNIAGQRIEQCFVSDL